mmetsp:Transcript_11121/g.20811  ORF Transcript_11121/g.20811 Transcript_11121/m.20811 type:complete len:477 (+) Transcript_11121:51-1481(+)
MGKKRRSSKRDISQNEETNGKDETININLNILPVVIVVFASIGFCFGNDGSTSVLPMPLSDWSMSGMMHSFKHLLRPFRYHDSHNFFYNERNDKSSDPLVFAALREAIIREGGFVHPDLGLMVPAPSGAHRGIGMMRDSYNTCQTRCMPGTIDEKSQHDTNIIQGKLPYKWNATFEELNSKEKVKSVADRQRQSMDEQYKQEEILIKVPLSYQMTRQVALETLTPLIPPVVQKRIPLYELDDAELLVLLLAYERGRGIRSKFHPYIASLPTTPTCGFYPDLRSLALQTVEFMAIELGMDVYGWPGEIKKAGQRSQMIVQGLAKDYGEYIQPSSKDDAWTLSVLHWSFCQVASRATAGSDRFGALRLVPMADMVNHYVDAGGFWEILSREDKNTRLPQNEYLVDETGKDAGTFVVRSLRLGRRNPLMKGQELLVNYNVPQYSPLDWFISMGFVPPERMRRLEKIDGVFKESRSFATT